MTKRSLEQIEESLRARLAEGAGKRDADHDGIPDDEERQPLLPGSSWGGTRDDPVHQIAIPFPGGGGRGSSSVPGGSGPKVWRRGGEPTPPSKVPNVWRRGEATPRPDNPPIGGQVGKVPKKKLDEPVDLAKEFDHSYTIVKM